MVRTTHPAPVSHPDGAAARAVATMHPGSFAFVMATGIVSTGLLTTAPALSRLLLAVAVVGAAILLVEYAVRLLRFRAAVLGDLHAADRAFGFLTLVAGLDVLATRLWLGGSLAPAVALAAVGAVGWLVLGYAVPAALMLGPRRTSIAESVNGGWFLWVVATQSVAVCASVFAQRPTRFVDPLADGAAALWGVGVVLYLMLLGLVTLRLLSVPVTAHGLSPTYWIYMGATAITALAGAHLLALPDTVGVLRVVRPVVAGLTFLLWAFGTWWVPLLVVFGVWRHGVRREPVRYEAAWWSIVFPLGMYADACSAFGSVEHLPFLLAIARVAVWVAVAAWVLAAGAGIRSVARVR